MYIKVNNYFNLFGIIILLTMYFYIRANMTVWAKFASSLNQQPKIRVSEYLEILNGDWQKFTTGKI